MSKKHEPTPNLGKPDSRRQHFTYSENKLLDQVTTEVMEAWKSDLKTIKMHHKEILNSQVNANNLSNLISAQFPKLEKFLHENSFINNFSEIKDEIIEINARHGIINQSLFDLNEKLNFNYIIKVQNQVKALDDKLKIIIQNLDKANQRRWWHKFIKPKS